MRQSINAGLTFTQQREKYLSSKKCLCGNPAVVHRDGSYICARCLDIEKREGEADFLKQLHPCTWEQGYRKKSAPEPKPEPAPEPEYDTNHWLNEIFA